MSIVTLRLSKGMYIIRRRRLSFGVLGGVLIRTTTIFFLGNEAGLGYSDIPDDGYHALEFPLSPVGAGWRAGCNGLGEVLNRTHGVVYDREGLERFLQHIYY